MTAETQMILFILGSFASTLTAGTIAHISVVQRIARLEAVFELMGGKALKKMHSPTNHHGLDRIIEKYAQTHDLTMDEWVIVRDVCEKIVHEAEEAHEHPGLALMAFGLAIHKLQRYGVKPTKTL